jgi:hypothetical protein
VISAAARVLGRNFTNKTVHGGGQFGVAFR